MKISKSYRLFQVFNGMILMALCFVTIYPIIYVIAASFSDGAALVSHTGFLFKPVGKANVDAFKAVLNNPNIFIGYRNTLMVLTLGTTFMVMMTSLGAYVLSRRNVKWKNIIMMLIVFTMFFEGGLVPFFLQVQALHLTDTLFSLVLPFSVNAYNLIIMRTSFAAIPYSLEESAKVDGARHWTILFKIILPLSKPVIAVMVLYYGVAIWNGWFWASVFLTDRNLYPLQLVLREILIANDTSSMTANQDVIDTVNIAETIKYATIVVSTVPILLVYPFLQRYFVKGVMIGAVKG
ncbi:carbohydrate ABC transporter permease [Vallitalea pronyensis]|uniref:Carbohydrate ABC transporter permease n=2 Tax=Vallitalea pronyensis TaxID=1348613 RepID=A0A8J8MQ16_9FIRM|nr:carbohydrate ABC transporter permease [Vallitalea pronyensis]